MIKIESLENIQQAAKNFINIYKTNKIIAFYGSMGSGKTTFIKAICKELNVKDNISSPTFAIVNEYSTSQQSVIYHFDMYRIKSINEALDFGFDEYMVSNNYCFIEWPEVIEDILPEGTMKINISVSETGIRELSERK